MSTFLTGSEISGMYLGSNEISEMYLGSNLFYSSGYKSIDFRFVNNITSVRLSGGGEGSTDFGLLDAKGNNLFKYQQSLRYYNRQWYSVTMGASALASSVDLGEVYNNVKYVRYSSSSSTISVSSTSSRGGTQLTYVGNHLWEVPPA